MFGFQTLACLHDIPVIRSSANKIQDIYAKAKFTSPVIRLPCHLAETVADTSLKLACTVTNPLVKPLSGTVRIIDDYAAKTIRQMEAKYPVINTPAEDVMNRLNEKTQPVRHVMNSVKDTTTSTIQQGKETVSNVAHATVNRANELADSVYTFCERHVPGKTISAHRHDFARRTTLLWERIKLTIRLPVDYVLESIGFFIIWLRMLLLLCLTKLKQTNDFIVNKIQRQSLLFLLLQRILIRTGSILAFLMIYIRPNDRPEPKQKPNRSGQQKQQFVSRPTLKPGAFLNASQSTPITKTDTPSNHSGINKQHSNKDELRSRLPMDNNQLSTSLSAESYNNESDKSYLRMKTNYGDTVHSQFSIDVTSVTDNRETLVDENKCSIEELST